VLNCNKVISLQRIPWWCILKLQSRYTNQYQTTTYNGTNSVIVL